MGAPALAQRIQSSLAIAALAGTLSAGVVQPAFAKASRQECSCMTWTALHDHPPSLTHRLLRLPTGRCRREWRGGRRQVKSDTHTPSRRRRRRHITDYRTHESATVPDSSNARKAVVLTSRARALWDFGSL